MASGYAIQLEGVDHLRRVLNADHLITKPVRKALGEIGKVGKTEAKGDAPRRAGKLSQSIGYRVDSKARYVSIQVAAKRGSVNYPRILEFSPKHHHKGWLMSALRDVSRWAGGVINNLASDIEASWKSR